MFKNLINNWLHVTLLVLVVAVSPAYAADSPSSERIEAARDSGVWQVAEEESLSDIARALFPKRTELQNRFIKDVTGLNFDIFGSVTRSKFKPGARIKLPGYALSEAGFKARNKAEVTKPTTKPTTKPSRLPMESPQPEKTKPVKKKIITKKNTSVQAVTKSIVSERVQEAKRIGKIEVAPGETIFRLSRLFFPQRPKARQLFIQDVIKLNPEVFNSAKINAIPAGAVLELPSYVWGKEKKRKKAGETIRPPLVKRDLNRSQKSQQAETVGPTVPDKTQADKTEVPQQVEVYADQYMTESELLAIDVGGEKDQLPGRRLLEMEYQYYLNKDDFLGDETEQGLHTRYRRETMNYGELDFELSLSDFTQDDNTQNHEGSDALITIRQTAMPISNDFLLNNALGHQRSSSDPFLHGGYRFRLPTSPMLGYSSDLFSSNQRAQWFAGLTGSYEGVAMQQFNDDGGTLIGASYQQELTPSVSLGGQISNLQGHDEVADHSSILLAGKYAPSSKNSHELHLLADDNSKFGAWSDSKYRLTPGMVFRYGAFYLDQDLLWTDADIADDQLGLYLRFDKQGFRNNFSAGYDFFETGIENNALITSSNHTVYFNNNYRVNRKLTLGVAGSVSQREFTSTENDEQDSWRVNGFVYYRLPLGISRFEINISELDSQNPANSRESNRFRWSHDWKTPQRYRLTTELSTENEKLFEDELQQYTASLIYRQEVLDNLSWGGTISAIRSDSDQLGVQDGTSAGVDARWQMSPNWYTSLSANYNETTTDASTSSFFNTDNNVRTDGLWLTLGYAKTSGRPYPNFGIQNGSSGSGGISGVVFFDENRDGIRQVGEKLVQGVVLLLDGRYETRTDNRGRFEYRPVPSGSHHVRLAVEDLPLPWGLDDESPSQIDVRVRQTTEVNFPLVRVDQ